MIVLALILALQVDWRHSRPSMDWTFVGASQDVVLFTRQGPQPNLRWERQERREGTGGALSTMTLVEVDCPGGRSRRIQGTYYDRPNLEGAVIHTNRSPSEWRYPAPDTVGESFFRMACE